MCGFYATFESELVALESYVTGGGYLWLGMAGWGWNGGEPDGFPLPGGGAVSGPDLWESNDVTAPDHPVAAGLPSPFFGGYASHATLSGFLGGTVVTTTPGGDATLVEYQLGAGRVLALTQPVEFGWFFGEDAGIILSNGVPHAVDFEPFTDVMWLSTEPAEGFVPEGGSQTLVVTLDAAGLSADTYQATLVILTDDPLGGLYVPVTMAVTAP